MSKIESPLENTATARRAKPGRAALAALALLLAATPALAQTASQREESARPAPQDHPGPWSVSGGVGFTLDPGTFLMTLGAEYDVDDPSGFSVGPLAQFAVSDNNTIIAPTLNARYSFDLSDAKDDVARRLSPFLQGGVGFAYVNKERSGPRSDRDDVGFLLNMGVGLEFAIDDSVSIGNSILFNVLPVRTAHESFFFSWQFATVRFRF